MYQSQNGYNYTFVFYAERRFINTNYTFEKVSGFKQTWTRAYVYVALYVILIHLGQHLMKTRKKFELRTQLIAWNITLAVFSLLGAMRTIPEFIFVLNKFGIKHSICKSEINQGAFAYWAAMFCLSKFPELFDTAFIILRKQELYFLHWYHHCTVLLFCFYSTKDLSSTGPWFICMNYAIHALMYAYYACRAARFSIPKQVNILITILQITQMLIGIYINVNAYLIIKNGKQCEVTIENIYVCFLMYFSYFLLFCHYFYKAYLKKPSHQKQHMINGDQKKLT